MADGNTATIQSQGVRDVIILRLNKNGQVSWWVQIGGEYACRVTAMKIFSDNSFDKITAMLFFSELYQKEQDYSLDQIHRILKEGGQFILVDEVKPKKLWKKIIYFIIRTPLVIFTFFKSQLTTKPLKDIEKRLEKHHFKVIEEKLYLLDSLKLLRLKKS
ncbi:MAG: class I SAM-dependent methyltransferase [Candidatus Lokiarchaeota archaeon]